jgi:hypothetical protein
LKKDSPDVIATDERSADSGNTDISDLEFNRQAVPAGRLAISFFALKTGAN